MSSLVFDQVNGFDEYRNHESIRSLLNDKYTLLNRQEFMEWFSGLKTSLRLSKNPDYTRRRNQDTEEYKSQVLGTLQTMVTHVCGGLITEEYGKSAIQRLEYESFDLLVAVHSDYKLVVPAKRIKSIVGFMITEKGECKILNEVYSVNLICSADKNFKSTILLGAYLYCIKNHKALDDPNKIGILELAGSYNNLPGFFAYTKVGFDKNNDLFGSGCFQDPVNLPMSVDTSKYSSDQIIAFVKGNEKRNDVQDDTGIYKLGIPSEKDQYIQKDIANVYSMKQYLVLTKTDPEDTKYIKIVNNKHDNIDAKVAKLEEYINKRKTIWNNRKMASLIPTTTTARTARSTAKQSKARKVVAKSMRMTKSIAKSRIRQK